MEKPGIVLSLSGGGVRAMAFHAGVLKFLAEKDAFNRIKAVSTVSGGTLLMGLIYAKNNFKWPSSDEYLNFVHKEILDVLERNPIRISEKSWASYFFLLRPIENLIFLFKTGFRSFKKANSFAAFSHKLNKCWGITGTLNSLNLENGPNWIINGASAEYGCRVYVDVNKKKMICYEEKRLENLNIERSRLSDLVAISAAVPAFIGPYKKNINGKLLHFYDGGVYDNLGTEQFLKIGTGELTKSIKGCVLLISDAGAPLDSSFPKCGIFNFKRLFKIYKIIAEQSRRLRLRDFFQNYMNKHKGYGAHFRIGYGPKEASTTMNSEQRKAVSFEEMEKAFSQDNAIVSKKVDTSISALDKKVLQSLVEHGFESAVFFTRINKVKGLE